MRLNSLYHLYDNGEGVDDNDLDNGEGVNDLNDDDGVFILYFFRTPSKLPPILVELCNVKTLRLLYWWMGSLYDSVCGLPCSCIPPPP